jgi:hypothetical protein
LFPASIGKTGKVSRRPLVRTDAADMLKLKQAGLPAYYSPDSFRATGITNFPDSEQWKARPIMAAGEDGVEKFVATPELFSESSIGSDPLPPGQAWVISPGSGNDNPGLYQVNISEGPGSGVKILNQPTSPPLKESARCAEQNLYARAKELVGDRDSRQHEFSVQLRAFDSAKSGAGVGVGVLLALCSSLLQKSIKGGFVITGGLRPRSPSTTTSMPAMRC